MQWSGCICDCVYENMCILTAVWYISLLYCGTMILHSSVLPSLWSQPTSYYTACAPCPYNSEFRQNLSWLAHIGFVFFFHQPHKGLVRKQILYWTAVCRVHLWTSHVEHLKDTLEQEGYRCAFVCSQVCPDPRRASVCIDVWLSVYVCLWGVRLNVHIWCGYKTYVGEKDVCSEKGNSRAFYMDFTDSWSVCICANRCACVRACMRACVGIVPVSRGRMYATLLHL